MKSCPNAWPAVVVVLTIGFCAICASATNAQPLPDPMSAGRHYVLAFPDTTRNTRPSTVYAPRYEERWLLFVYSPGETRLWVRAPGTTRPSRRISAGTTVIDLRSPDLMLPDFSAREPLCQPRRATVLVDADDPVIISCFMSTPFGAEAWTPLPVEAWGAEYVVAAHAGEIVHDVTIPDMYTPTLVRHAAPAQIVVVAAYDLTHVAIIPTAPLDRACLAGAVTLNAGEVVLIQSAVDTTSEEVQGDIAGTRISADKPIGVMTGNTRAQLIPEVASIAGNATRNLMVEWLSPVEYHGRTFVFMPTCDSRRPTGIPGENLAEKRTAEIVRSYATSGESTAGRYILAGETREYAPAIPAGGVHQTRHLPNEAAVHTTDAPAQVMMAPAATSVLRSTQGGEGFGPKYDSWGGYMVELVPRERWTTFAPLAAPSSPAGVEHYANLVVDSANRDRVLLANGQRINFPRIIPGTGLCWGTISLQPGTFTYAYGQNGARFGGFVYGLGTVGGGEAFRQGIVRPPDDPPERGAPGGLAWLHPSEYEEHMGIAYGYPIASPYIVLGRHDSIDVRWNDAGCGRVELAVSILADRPAGIRSIELKEGENVGIAPAEPVSMIGALSAELELEPVERARDAHGTIIITSRTGERREVSYAYTADRITVDTAAVTAFGRITTRHREQRVLPITNNGSGTITITRISLGESPAFSLMVDRGLPAQLAPGEPMNVAIFTTGQGTRGRVVDTLRVQTPCITAAHAVTADMIAPTIVAEDVDFGELAPTTAASAVFRITNTSSDTLTLSTSADSVLMFESTRFSVSPASRAELAGLRVPPGLSAAVALEFSGADVGEYACTVRVVSNAVAGKETALWRALVREISSAPTCPGNRTIITWVPGARALRVELGTPLQGALRLELFDLLGARRLEYTRLRGQAFSLSTSGLSPGPYFARLSVAGATLVVRPVYIDAERW